jgi:hypothetical protein
VARADFARPYPANFSGRTRAIIPAGVARGHLRRDAPRPATWLLLGMMYPFFAPGPDHEHVPQAMIDLLLAVFFDGTAA